MGGPPQLISPPGLFPTAFKSSFLCRTALFHIFIQSAGGQHITVSKSCRCGSAQHFPYSVQISEFQVFHAVIDFLENVSQNVNQTYLSAQKNSLLDVCSRLDHYNCLTCL